MRKINTFNGFYYKAEVFHSLFVLALSLDTLSARGSWR